VKEIVKPETPKNIQEMSDLANATQMLLLQVMQNIQVLSIPMQGCVSVDRSLGNAYDRVIEGDSWIRTALEQASVAEGKARIRAAANEQPPELKLQG